MSTALVPNRFFFRFEIPIRRAPKSWTTDGNASKWTDKFLVAPLGAIDGEEPFGDVWLAWSEAGLFVACRVEGKELPLQCSPESFWKGDNLRICTDMRDTRDIKRASRFCQQFYLLPAGGPKNSPVAASTPIHRAKETAPPVAPEQITVRARVGRDGYFMEALLPADGLSGFDPDEHRRIGIYYMLEDQDHGQQCLTVGDALNWYVDPSTWATGVLTQ